MEETIKRRDGKVKGAMDHGGLQDAGSGVNTFGTLLLNIH